MENDVVKELNAFLEGHYMGIHEYERFIQHLTDDRIKKEFQKIQQTHKLHAMKIAERIQNLGGRPADGPGFMGTMAETMNRLKGTAEDTGFIIKDACRGEDRGIKMSEEIIKGDLDAESMQLVKEILEDDRKHIELLKSLVH